jgi:hypothetical protein
MLMSELRPELPRPIPARIRRLPVSRGYPVPWFVTWLSDGEPCERGAGEPDFRIIVPEAIVVAVRHRRCWVCGGALGKYMAFVIGPMCAVNLNTAEPPSHLDCADWSARACPFLTRPHMRRNEGKAKPEGVDWSNSPGVALTRNPGVALVWTTTSYRIRLDGQGGVLFQIGKPHDVRWYCEGRPATRAEVKHSIDTGLPALEELAAAEGALDVLRREVDRAEALLPA